MIWWVALFFIAGMVLIISAILGIYSYPDYGLFIIIGELLGVGASLVLGFVILTRTPAANLLTLKDAQTQEAGYVSASSDLALLNQEGMVLTALRPAGTITIGDKRVDAVSNGTFIDKGTRVRVLEVHGSRVVVEPVEFE